MSSAKIKTSFTYKVRQRNLTFIERLVYEGGAYSCHGTGIIGSVRFCSFRCHGAVEPTTPNFRRGDVFKNGESVIITQRKFRLHFNDTRHGRIPSRNTILLWVHNVLTTASATKKHGVSKRTVRTPENLEALRNAVDQSPHWSVVRHAQALRLSDTTVRRILHQDLNFHPYKLLIVQELNEQGFGRRIIFAETMLQMFEEHPELVIVKSDEAHFHLIGNVNKQNFRSGRRWTLGSWKNVRYIVIRLQFGLRWLSSEW